jgi:RNA recognition motif-containing protein
MMPFQPLSTLFNRTISKNQTIRSISSCLHVKGLPVALPDSYIYDFFKNYGTIQEFATFPEASKTNNDVSSSSSHENMQESRQRIRMRNHINHDRPPGTTAIISFTSTTSAIMCKEELHWRPFPIEGLDEEGNEIYRQFVDRDIVVRNPRDRPIVNILFETNHMRAKLRPWVKRNLVKSKEIIKDWENPIGANEAKNDTAICDANLLTSNNAIRQMTNSQNDADMKLELKDVTDENIIIDDSKVTDEIPLLSTNNQETKDDNYSDTSDEKIDFYSMKIVELQQECKSRNLPYYGRKAALVERLEATFRSV